MPNAAQIDALLAQLAQVVQTRRRRPESTYRLQFNRDFTFRDAAAIVPYLHDLGITDCYSSPYLKGRPGSGHGYDVVDHRVLNPEIGTEEDYEAFTRALAEHAMGQLYDVVPNHMGIIGNVNPWWNDVLENGPSSPYAHSFDIDWHPVKPALQDKVLLPFLGGPYGQVLEAGELSLRYEHGEFSVHYYDLRFPLAPRSWRRILNHRLAELEKTLPAGSPELMEYQSIATALGHLPPRTETDPARVAERQREKKVIKRRLAALTDRCAPVRAFLARNLTAFNGQKGEPRSFDLLDDLLDDQAYRLAFWRVAADEINYRRFFDVNELAALCMEKPDVFEATHVLIFRLLREGKITGLRIDHPDGLYDPHQYLERLQEHYALGLARDLFLSPGGRPEEEWDELEGPFRQALGQARADPGSPLHRPLYLVVEKILCRDEPVPEDWPVDGTVGYEFLNTLNGLFINPNTAGAFGRIYRRFGRVTAPFAELVYQKKFLTLQVSLSSELHLLAHQLDRLSENNRWSRDFTLNSLRHALREIIACFPVYRSYISEAGTHPRDRLYVETAVILAKGKNPAISGSIFDFVKGALLQQFPGPEPEMLAFAAKFQQVTSPVMAKGVEDTSFYVYNRLLSVNEVGGDADRFGVPPLAFHFFNQQRQAHHPLGLSATSTHDTKRSEDVRARLNVLSEIPNDWRRHLKVWYAANEVHQTPVEGLLAPDPNDEYLIYQTLVGAWPLEGAGGLPDQSFTDRIQQYLQKAIHEAKVHTSWINPNPIYDEAVRHFVARILDPATGGPFLEDFLPFQKRVSHYGLFNSLSQTLFKITSPGVADVYRGTELWDFSLVDPDNRRPVDFRRRREMVSRLQGEMGKATAEQARRLVETREDGRVKLYLTYRALHCRREHPGLFADGDYLPVESLGSLQNHASAFVRCLPEGPCALAVVPRLLTALIPGERELPLGQRVWQDTILVLPGIGPGRRFRNILTNELVVTTGHAGKGVIALAWALANFPVALLLAEG
jgi:(1->4)-alpha-D-glucan 1-alpha-D-glucosylmutase